MHQTNQVAIVASTAAQAQELQQWVGLRGFDQVRTYSLDEAIEALLAEPVDLILLDVDAHWGHLGLTLLKELPGCPPSLVLASQFDEELFLSFHEAGARDFLLKPVNASYLMSRVLQALEERHNVLQLTHWQGLLRELDVLSSVSQAYSSVYFQRLLGLALQRLMPQVTSAGQTPGNGPLLCLVALQLDYQQFQALEAPKQQEVMGWLGRLLQKTIRVKDAVGEWAPGTFLVLLTQTGQSGVRAVQARLEENLTDKPLVLSGGLSLQLLYQLTYMEVTAESYTPDLTAMSLIKDCLRQLPVRASAAVPGDN